MMKMSDRRRKDAILRHKMKMAVKLGKRDVSKRRLDRAARAVRKAAK